MPNTFIYILIGCAIISIASSEITNECNLSRASPYETSLLKRLEPLLGKNYETTNGSYTYYFAVCATPSKAENKNSNVGIVQEKVDESTKARSQVILGRLNDVDLEAGDYSIRIKYNDGELYGEACDKSARSAVILVTCVYDKEDEFKYMDENYHRGKDCGYIFELRTSKICPARSYLPDNNSEKSKGGLGAFSIILIIVFSAIFAYLAFGVVYMRFVRNERGLKMIPNYNFWKRISNFKLKKETTGRLRRRQSLGDYDRVPTNEPLVDDIGEDDDSLVNVLEGY